MKNYTTVSFGQINILNNPEHASERYKAFAETLKHNPMDFFSVQEITLPEEFVETMSEAGYEYGIISDSYANARGHKSAVGIFSKTPIQKIEFNNPWEKMIIAAKTSVNDQTYNVFSAHLAWGPFNLFSRLNQVSIIDRVAGEEEKKDPGSVSVLGSDMNADPEARPIRFLKGYDLASDNFSSTLWLDAYEIAGNSDNWTTSDHATNFYGKQTAINNGVIDTDMLPQRRIDYIFSRGWLYGKTGFPVDFGYLDHPQGVVLSDHNGIFARFAVIQ